MKIEEILKANICAFGQTIFDMLSLEEDEFSRALNYYIEDNNFEEALEEYAYEFDYDLYNIKNISRRKNFSKKEFDYMDVISCSIKAYLKTINKDKTISAEALVDNILDELKKLNK